MPDQTRIVSPGPKQSGQPTARFDSGEVHPLPDGWAILPPGDAGLTRRVKAAGPTWTVTERRGRKTFSRGVWAPAVNIDTARRRLEVERADPAYSRRLDAGRRRQAAKQDAYVLDFEAAILGFLDFAPCHSALADQLARRVADHATPVGSGTVARTQRIPVQERAKAAVLAWMRHQTTDYDHRVITREKGKRREVRRELSKASRRILSRYRAGEAPQPDCPLRRALKRPGLSTAVPTAPVATLTSRASRPALPSRPARPARPALLVTPAQKPLRTKPSPWGKIARLPARPKPAARPKLTDN